jgi:preprotein translocase subunit SecD
MPQYEIAIEESKQLIDSGILVIRVKNSNLKYYAKVKSTKDPKLPFELEFLTVDQLKKMGIQVEETVAQQDGNPMKDVDVDVEESAGEPEGKNAVKVSANDPESIENAKKLLKKMEEKANIEQVIQERDDLKEKLDMLATAQFEKKKRELNAPDSITTVEALKAYEEGIRQKENGGSAPMNDRQMGIPEGSDDIMKVKFNSVQDEIRELRRRERHPNPEIANQAKELLTALYQKSLDAGKQGQPPQTFDPNTKEALQDLRLIKKDGFLTPLDPEEGDLAQFKKTKRKRLQEQDIDLAEVK